MRTNSFSSNRHAYLGAVLVCLMLACTSEPKNDPKRTQEALVARGEYLVSIAVCDDCHSPKVQSDRGPEPDMARRLSGHPADASVPQIPSGVLGPGQWAFIGNDHMTSWGGPWGVSFASNLTPHPTGLASWTEAQFVETLRTGRHLGVGRPVLPPMPWPAYRHMTDEDLKAVYAFLRTLTPVSNLVPQPVLAEFAQKAEP